jgi:hypothetical protein
LNKKRLINLETLSFGEITKKIRWPLGKTLKENPKIPLTLEALLYMAHILVYKLLKNKDKVKD